MRPEVGKILTRDQVNYLRFGDSDCPQKTLGRHLVEGGQVISFYHPYGKEAVLEFEDEEYLMENVEKTNIFSAFVPHRKDKPYYIRIILEDNCTIRIKDPYAFKVQLKRKQLELWEKGKWLDVYRYLGAHPMTLNGIAGVHFVVWAPNAKRVSVVGDFNNWDGRMNPMIRRSIGGIFELFLPELQEGIIYKYEIKTPQGDVFLKSDPFANEFEIAPKNASIVTELQGFQWSDKQWMECRKDKDIQKSPVAIYEVHLGSWKRVGEKGDQYLSYADLAHQLADYILRMGYTHVELLGVLEHLREESIGHEITGFYAPTSRFGSARELMYLINHLHENGIGVILDWTPVGMSKDSAGMTEFDGSHLFETTDPKKVQMMRWNNLPFDYSKRQVVNYMLSNARFWMNEFHIDGFRIAALNGLLYEDSYHDNEMGRHFLQIFTEMIAEQKNGCIVITEKLPKVLNYVIKSTFQWAGDHIDPLIRHVRKAEYAERELENQIINRFQKLNSTGQKIIKISHRFNERIGSIISQMPGDYFAKFANLRVLYGFIIGMQGKKHFFMGQDFGQWNRWDIYRSLDWHLLGEASHEKLQNYVRDLIYFYREHNVLYETDYEAASIKWLTRVGESEIVFFQRKNPQTGEELIFICNFTPMDYQAFKLGVPEKNAYLQSFSSDAQEYGGLGSFENRKLEVSTMEWNGFPYTLTLQIPRQSIIILEKEKKKKVD